MTRELYLIVERSAVSLPSWRRLADGHQRGTQAAGVPRAAGRRVEFELRRVALLPEQVRELRLPSTPLKPTEKRADKWVRETGTEQTEIDAVIALDPAALEEMARWNTQHGLAPYFVLGRIDGKQDGEIAAAWRERN